MDYYQTLHISEKASQEEIRKAYRKLAVKYHPDNAGEQAREQFDKVQEAYGVLGDEEKRAAYDERRRGGEADDGLRGKKAGKTMQDSRVDRERITRILLRFTPEHIKTVLNSFLRRACRIRQSRKAMSNR